MSRRVQVCILALVVHTSFPAAGGEPDWDGVEKQMLQPKNCPPGMRLIQTDHPDQGYTQACLDERARQQGWALMFYPDGQAREYTEAKDGQLHGRIMGWYENGRRKYFYEYQKGDRHGLAVQWFENGQKKCEGHYRHGFRQDLWQCWFPDGQLQKRGQFRQDRESGTWEYWHEDGAVSDHEIYPRPAEKPARHAEVEQVESAGRPPQEPPPGVLIGAALVSRKMLLEDQRLGSIKQIAGPGGTGLWLVGEKGALRVDAGYSPRKWVDFSRPALEASLLDLEGDGQEDFIVRSRLLGHHGFFDLTFILDSAGAERSLSPPLWGNRCVSAGDLDGDGKAELVALGSWRKGQAGDFERGAGPRPFALTREGWGTFALPLRIFLKSGPVQEMIHRIRF